MKIEKINENKIKVTISFNDLEERNIDLNSLNYNSPETQELFLGHDGTGRNAARLYRFRCPIMY